MNYLEAKKLAEAWTAGCDITQDGWMAAMALLLQRVNSLESTNKGLHAHIHRLNNEIESLSLDLGIKDQSFRISSK